MTISKNDPKIKKALESFYLVGYRPHHVEQIIFRIYCCENCLIEKKCNFCTCNPIDKIKEPISCNKDVFPDFMQSHLWAEYKTKHNLEIT